MVFGNMSVYYGFIRVYNGQILANLPAFVIIAGVHCKIQKMLPHISQSITALPSQPHRTSRGKLLNSFLQGLGFNIFQSMTIWMIISFDDIVLRPFASFMAFPCYTQPSIRVWVWTKARKKRDLKQLPDYLLASFLVFPCYTQPSIRVWVWTGAWSFTSIETSGRW